MAITTMLQRKLFRDLGIMRGQVVTIAMVVACGVASFVALRSTWRALQENQQTYYDQYHFADVFVALKRAPELMARRIEQLPGVAAVYTRIVADVRLPMLEAADSASGRVISLPEGRPPALCGVYLREGHWPNPARTDEVLVLESFAQSRQLRLGHTVKAVIGGRHHTFRVAGLAISPEFIMPVADSAVFVDSRHFIVLWLPRRVLAPLMQMEGAFNDVTLKLQPRTTVRAVLAEVDRMLVPFGGMGAVPRERQPSHRVLSGELEQLQGMALLLPMLLLGVAAFLVNTVLSFVVRAQRTQIATLKAMGYPNRAIGLHYLALVSVVAGIGSMLGILVGLLLGRGMIGLYGEFFHFPVLVHHVELDVVATAVAISLGTVVAGSVLAVRGVVRLSPAVAMRPAAPELYHRATGSDGPLRRLAGVLGAPIWQLLPPMAKMVLREARRHLGRTLVSSLGIALSVGLLVVGRYMADASDGLMYSLFTVAQREDLSVTFSRSVPEHVARELTHLQGVWRVEPLRQIPVRFHHGAIFRDSVLMGHAPGEKLRAIVEWPAHRVMLPLHGVVLTSKLAEILAVAPGQSVEVERLDGEHQWHRVVVSGLSNELSGMQGHMALSALDQILREQPTATGALLQCEPRAIDQVQASLKQIPGIRSVTRRETSIQEFRSQNGKSMAATTVFLMIFATAIALGVIYNNARITLVVKSRDLATLRVLGFTRREINAALLGELALQVVLAIPPGLWVGRGLTWLLAQSSDSETFRFPVDISLRTYFIAVAITLMTTTASALLVRRQLNALDLVGALKTGQ